MFYLLIALAFGFVSSTPLFLAGQKKIGIIYGVVATLLYWWFSYSFVFGYAGPMFGSSIFLLSVGLTVAAVFCFILRDDGDRSGTAKTVILPALSWALYIGVAFFGSEMLNAAQYRSLVGDMEKRVWTQDIQPKDPAHVRLVSDENALYVAKKVVGELGTIGSQFSIGEQSLTLQAIKGELWYVVPLDFAGWRAWNNAGTSVGYIMVHAEDPNRQPVVKQLPKEKQFVYTPGAYFGNDLIRHLRLDKDYMRVVLEGTHLEIDEEGEAHWVTAVLEPSIGQYGNKVKGVLITNPVSGESTFARIGEVPAWVDRVIPRSVAKDYLTYWGEYVHEWMNSWWGKRDLTQPENPSLIYSSAHDPMFVTGVTSQNNKDDSLVGIVYTHARTGKSVFYEVKGGATAAAVSGAVAKFQDVQFKHLHPGNPQLYNLYGTMSSIVPLLNENHAYSGVAIANISNVQQVAVGRSLSEAIRQYQRLLGQSGDSAHIDNTRKLSVVEGVIARVKQDLTQAGSVYYIVVDGTKHALVGGTGEFPLLPLAQAGDRVKIEFYASGEAIVPMHSFDNLTLPLEKTAGETAVEARKLESRDANQAKPARRDVEERLKTATPDELRRLNEALQMK